MGILGGSSGSRAKVLRQSSFAPLLPPIGGASDEAASRVSMISPSMLGGSRLSASIPASRLSAAAPFSELSGFAPAPQVGSCLSAMAPMLSAVGSEIPFAYALPKEDGSPL